MSPWPLAWMTSMRWSWAPASKKPWNSFWIWARPTTTLPLPGETTALLV
jgi:hypothetical protein